MPRELQLGLDWRGFRVPPYEGGLMDQPIGLMDKIRACLNIYDAMNVYHKAEDSVKWARENPELWQIASNVLSARSKGEI